MAFYYCDVCKLINNEFISCTLCADKHNDMQICIECCKSKKVYNCVYFDNKNDNKILFICDYCLFFNKDSKDEIDLDPKDEIDLEFIKTHLEDIIKIKKEYPQLRKDKLMKQIKYFETQIDVLENKIDYFEAEIECLKTKLNFEDTELDTWVKGLLHCTDQKQS